MDDEDIPTPPDWEAFKRRFDDWSLNPQQPPSDHTDWMEPMMQASWDEAMHNVPRPGREEVFETHRYVVVKLRVKDVVLLDQIRLLINDSELIVKWSRHRERRIRFPVLVVPKTARAKYRDGVLQIIAIKKKGKSSYLEIPVRY